MAGNFSSDQRSCEECGENCPTNDAPAIARYTQRRNLCDVCAMQGSCADDIWERRDPTTSLWRCNEHPNRDVILYCVNCGRPICDVCSHLTHVGHKYMDLNMAAVEKRDEMTQLKNMIRGKLNELGVDRGKLDAVGEAINRQFAHLQYAVLSRVREKSKTFEDDFCVSERKITQRAKEEKLKIDRWKDNRLKEIKQEKDTKNLKIQQRQCALIQELTEVKQKLLDQLKEYSEGLDSAAKVISEARESAERALSGGDNELLSTALPTATTPITRLNECLDLTLDDDAVGKVKDIAESVRFEPEIDVESPCLLGKFVTTAPAWCKMHTIQVGLPKFRLLNATKNNNHVSFTCENGDQRYGLYTMDIDSASTNLVTSDALCVTHAASIERDLIALSRNDRSAIEVWNTAKGKVKKHIKVPRTWSHTCLAVDREGRIVARDHASSHGKIYIYRSDTGEKVQSVPYNGTIFSLHVLSNGHIVIQSAATEIVIIDQHGEVISTIKHETWQWVRCVVDHDDRILVAYGRKDDATSIFVDSYSADGAVIEHMVKHKCSPSLDRIAVVVTRSGRVVLQNGDDLAIYDRLIPLDPVMTSQPQRDGGGVVGLIPHRQRTSSSSPRSRRNLLMCIPT